MRVLVQEEGFDLGEEMARFSAQDDIGAIVSFTGVVRNSPAGDLVAMEIEHYPAMTQPALAKIAEQAMARWDLGDVLIIHRFGRLAVGEQIMMVATQSPHRADAFEAAEFLMDFLKSRAPFWKKEITQTGAAWVAAKDSDEDALTRW